MTGDLQGNLGLAEAAVAAAIAAGAEVVVLPELITSGYCFASPDEAAASALPAGHEVFDRWRELIGDSVLVFGFAERAEDGTLYNSAMLLEHGSVPVVYRKMHLWNTEKLFFAAGSQLPPVVPTRYGPIGVMICYDLEFPELTRSAALRGARLLTAPTNWPYSDRPAGFGAPEVMIAQAAARVNRMAIACCDRTGNDRGQEWNSETTIISADGWPLARACGVDTVMSDVDLAAAEDKAISERNDVFGDRRTDVYP